MKKGPATTATTGKQAQSAPPPSKGFNIANYVRPGVTEDEAKQIKTAFDLFDTDQGGSIDFNCTLSSIQSSKQQWCLSASMPKTVPFSKCSPTSTRTATSRSTSTSGSTSWPTEPTPPAPRRLLAKSSLSTTTRRLSTYRWRTSEESQWIWDSKSRRNNSNKWSTGPTWTKTD